MTEVYLASYKGFRPGYHGIVNALIRYMDKSIYSHSEICIGNPFESEVECYSSSGVDKGVRMKRMKLSRENWDVLPLTTITAEHVIQCFLETKGEPYDYMGTGRFMLPMLLREHAFHWFCSEWAAWVAGYQDAWRFSPAGLVALERSKGAEFI